MRTAHPQSGRLSLPFSLSLAWLLAKLVLYVVLALASLDVVVVAYQVF